MSDTKLTMFERWLARYGDRLCRLTETTYEHNQPERKPNQKIEREKLDADAGQREKSHRKGA